MNATNEVLGKTWVMDSLFLLINQELLLESNKEDTPYITSRNNRQQSKTFSGKGNYQANVELGIKRVVQIEETKSEGLGCSCFGKP